MTYKIDNPSTVNLEFEISQADYENVSLQCFDKKRSFTEGLFINGVRIVGQIIGMTATPIPKRPTGEEWILRLALIPRVQEVHIEGQLFLDRLTGEVGTWQEIVLKHH